MSGGEQLDGADRTGGEFGHDAAVIRAMPRIQVSFSPCRRAAQHRWTEPHSRPAPCCAAFTLA